jgi:hypothetical protein
MEDRVAALGVMVCDPSYEVMGRCRTCLEQYVRFVGSPLYSSAVGVAVGSDLGAPLVDLVVTRPTSSGQVKVVANFLVSEVAGDTARAKAVAARALEWPVEIVYGVGPVPASIDASHRRCGGCVRAARLGKAKKANVERQRAVRKAGMRWLHSARQKRWKSCVERHLLWRLRLRPGKLKEHVERQIALDDAERFVACRKCREPVEVYERSTTKLLGAAIGMPSVDRVSRNRIYHAHCSPRCLACWEYSPFGGICACERAKRKQCCACKAWKTRGRAHACPVRKTKACPSGIEYVCSKCAVECKECKAKVAPTESRFGSRCYACNVARRKVANADLSLYKPVLKKAKVDGVCACGAVVDSCFAECLGCKYGSGGGE